jgi:hypothetical protein
MRFLPPPLHGAIDFLIAAFLVASPWLFNFDMDITPKYLALIAGLGILAANLFTDYECGLAPLAPLAAELGCNIAVGFVLLCTPLAFGFHPNSWVPLMAVGVVLIVDGMVTTLVSRHTRSNFNTFNPLDGSRV